MSLHVLHVGHGPVSYVFLHGLLGQGKNWATIAKALSPASSLLVDLPDHGRSRLERRRVVRGHGAGRHRPAAGSRPTSPVTLVGHSMGGKVAMLVALREPSLVGKLVVVDISPTVRTTDEFVRYVDAMLALDLDHITSRGEADAHLKDAGPRRHRPRDSCCRACSARTPAGPGGRTSSASDAASRASEAGPRPPGRTRVPCCGSGASGPSYVTEADLPAMRSLFPKVRLVTIKNAGHWVHADQPAVLADSLAHWVAATT